MSLQTNAAAVFRTPATVVYCLQASVAICFARHSATLPAK